MCWWPLLWDLDCLRKRVVVFVGFSYAVGIIGNDCDRVRAIGCGVYSALSADSCDAPGARGVLVNPQVCFTPSTKYATPTVTPDGVAALPWLLTTLVKLPLVLLYESEVGITSGRGRRRRACATSVPSGKIDLRRDNRVSTCRPGRGKLPDMHPIDKHGYTRILDPIYGIRRIRAKNYTHMV